MFRVCPSVYPDLRPFICPTVHSRLTVLAQPSHPALCWAHPPPLEDPLFFKEERPPGQSQIGSQGGCSTEQIFGKGGYTLPSELSGMGLPLTHFGL